MSSTKRMYCFDVMRIVAIFAAIMIHASGPFVKAADNGSVNFLAGNIFDSLSRFGVPVFIMISGALMLNEDKSVTPKKNLKSAGNIFVLLLIWSVLYALGYYIAKPILLKEPLSITDFIGGVFDGHYHLWFLFVLIGLYIATPLLRLFIKRENSKLIRNYLLFSVVLCFCVPVINEIVNVLVTDGDIVNEYFKKYRFDYLFEYLTYYIMGWYIANVDIKKKHRTAIYISGIAGLVLTVVFTQLFFIDAEKASNEFYSNGSINVFCYSVAIFLALYYAFKDKDLKENKIVMSMSSLTFGVYIVHSAFLFGFKMVAEKIVSSSLATIVISFTGAAVCSFVVCYIMSKIPVVKKLIRC